MTLQPMQVGREALLALLAHRGLPCLEVEDPVEDPVEDRAAHWVAGWRTGCTTTGWRTGWRTGRRTGRICTLCCWLDHHVQGNRANARNVHRRAFRGMGVGGHRCIVLVVRSAHLLCCTHDRVRYQVIVGYQNGFARALLYMQRKNICSNEQIARPALAQTRQPAQCVNRRCSMESFL